VSSVRRLAIDRAGVHTAAVALPRGRELGIVVTSVPGRELAWGTPTVIDDATGLYLTVVRAGDGWRCTGLGDGTVTVEAWGDGQCSPGRLRGVRAEQGRVALALKDRTDERDVGDHLAELHGELVDAVTGEVVAFRSLAIDVRPVVADGSTSPFDAMEPPAPAQVMDDQRTHRRFHEVGLAAGRWALLASVPGYALATQVVELREGEVRVGLRVPLEKQAAVRGRVLDREGRPLRGVTLLAVGTGPLADRHLEAWRQYRHAASDPAASEPSFTPLRGSSRADGSFAIERVPPGIALRLVARHDDHGFVVLPLPALRADEELAAFDVRMPGR
jgi:hypothetical protein